MTTDDPNSNQADQQEPSAEPTQAAPKQQEQPQILSWPQVVADGTGDDIKQRLTQEIRELANQFAQHLNRYCLLGLYIGSEDINSWYADQIYTALGKLNPQRDRDILLFIESDGGYVEPAYQISKLCRSYAKDKFTVTIPRKAKSAATLIALGADEIHIGPMGQLGPIDPQIGGLPALGVIQALKTMASLTQQYPESAEMFARYLRFVLSVEQISYCERVSESAVQYAERLLSTKQKLVPKANEMARALVYEYKDHRFVIDPEEAAGILGDFWIVTQSPELAFAEAVYQKLEFVNLLLGFFQRKYLTVTGSLEEGAFIWDKKR